MIILQATSDPQDLIVNPDLVLDQQVDDITFRFRNESTNVTTDITGSIVPDSYYGRATLTLDFLSAGDEYELIILNGTTEIQRVEVEVIPDGLTPETFTQQYGRFVQYTPPNRTKTQYRR